MLEMESLLYVIVHDNTNLRACLEGLEVNKDLLNVPITTKETAILPVVVHPHASTSALKEKNHARPPKLPMKPLPTI